MNKWNDLPDMKACPNPECEVSEPNAAELAVEDCGDTFFADCFACGLSAPYASTPKETIEMWNQIQFADG